MRELLIEKYSSFVTKLRWSGGSKYDSCKERVDELGNKRYSNHIPTIIYANGTREWYKCFTKNRITYSLLHRDNDLPAIIKRNGTCEWYKKGKLHREGDKPAVIRSNGRKEWWLNGKLYYRGDYKPTIICKTGERKWYLNNKLHRNKGLPAIISISKLKRTLCWYKKGKRHRDNDKPAFIEIDRLTNFYIVYWYINGVNRRVVFDKKELSPAIIKKDVNHIHIVWKDKGGRILKSKSFKKDESWKIKKIVSLKNSF